VTVKAKPKEAVSQSRLKLFNTCPMAEYYSYRVKGVGVKPTAVSLPYLEGEFGHYALMHYYKSGRMLRQNMLNRAQKLLDRDKPSMTPEEYDKAQIALAAMVGACLGYKVHYQSDKDKYDTLCVETTFEFKLGDYTFVGQIDWLVREKESKKIILWDHKFMGGVSASAYEALPLNIQQLIYCEGVKAITGKYPDLHSTNFILKSMLRRKKDRAGGKESLATFEARVVQQYIDEPDKKFFRPPPVRVDEKSLETVREHLALALDLFHTDKPPRMSFACLGMYGKACVFVPACRAKLMGRKDGWDAPECTGLYRLKETQHEELRKEDTDGDEEDKVKGKAKA